MLVKENLVKTLESYVDFPDELADRIMYESVYLGKTLYVVTQCSRRSKYEVVKVVVTSTRYNSRKDTKSFTVEGKYTNNNNYTREKIYRKRTETTKANRIRKNSE